MNYKLTTSRPNLSSALQDYRDWVIGYDKIFNTMLNQPSNSITNQPNYPPHNLIELLGWFNIVLNILS